MNNLRQDIISILIMQGRTGGMELAGLVACDPDEVFDELIVMQIQGLVASECRGCFCFYKAMQGQTGEDMTDYALDEFCPGCARFWYSGGPISKALAELEVAS